MSRDRIVLGDNLIVQVGLGPREWHESSGVEVYGKKLIVRDLHGNDFWRLEFRPLVKTMGDVDYVLWTPYDETAVRDGHG